jgi:DNA-directed RNA polymerase subunit beta
LINSLATYARVNKYGFIETPYRKLSMESYKDTTYLRLWMKANILLRRQMLNWISEGRFTADFVSCRRNGEFVVAPASEIDLMDVSPKQIVSVAASLIPFIENDDANRALMGSNMQRQAVPLLRTEAPFVGTGMEGPVARDSGVAVIAKRTGIVDQVDASRIVIRVTDESVMTTSNVDIYNLLKFQRSNDKTCINQKPLVTVGDKVEKGDIIADGPCMDTWVSLP